MCSLANPEASSGVGERCPVHMPSLLAVDLGVKTGLALFNRDGRLLWCRSHNFGTIKRLREGVYRMLGDVPDLSILVLEGGGAVAEVWEREAKRRSITLYKISAEEWRKKLLYPREQRSGPLAKHNAGHLARRVVAWSRMARPTSLRHDTAEAILVGLWGVLEVGWLKKLPAELRQ